MSTEPDTPTSRVRRLYSRRRRFYEAYVQFFRHRQGIAAVLASSRSLHPGQRILDAGCGSGLSLLAIDEAFRRRGHEYRSVRGFDLTPAMLDTCTTTLRRAGIAGVELEEADVTRLEETLPVDWTDYDLIVCASMLEYIAPSELAAAFGALRTRLGPSGHLLTIITRRTFLPTRWIWHCHGYSRRQLLAALDTAGYENVTFRRYPARLGWLNVAEHVIEADNQSQSRRGTVRVVPTNKPQSEP